jgi:ethanolamine utilization microcompartment shell protein EutS
LTATEITGLIAQVTTSVVAIIAAWAAFKAGNKAAETGAKVETLQKSTDVAAKSSDVKLGEIHQLTNSNLTSVKSDLEMANKKINELQEMVVKLVEEKQPPDGPNLQRKALGEE